MQNQIPIKKLILLFFTTACYSAAFTQPAERFMSREQYIDKFSSEAINQMVEYKIPASITLAQGILESGNGNSELAKYGNNHFGIKCHNWEGEEIYQDDDIKNECFRKYSSALESFEDHSIFLSTRSRYAFLFDLSLRDYKGWAKGLRKAGYATNPKYATIIISLIEKYNLNKYDKSILSAQTKPTKKQLSKTSTIKNPSVHKIELHPNNIKFIKAKKGDTFYSIASEFEMGLWQIYKYNDLANGDILKVDDVIFLQPKRNRCKLQYHIIEKGDDLNSISQHYGLKIKKILKLNKLTLSSTLQVGSKIYLKKSIK